jgi:fatty acid-binding protein DegV
LGDIERNSATIPLHVSNDEVAASDAVSLHPDKNYKYKNKKNENNNQ